MVKLADKIWAGELAECNIEAAIQGWVEQEVPDALIWMWHDYYDTSLGAIAFKRNKPRTKTMTGTAP